MASRTYRANALVLRKTKLRESDLILTLLAEDGSQIRAVAKGARKPTSSFASRLELYASAELLLAQGRDLDIVKEARALDPRARLRIDMEHAACAAPIAELLARTTHADLPVGRLYGMAASALDHLAASPPSTAPSLTAAALLKAFAMLGFRPSLNVCVSCGASVDIFSGGRIRFSPREGGAICAECARGIETLSVEADACAWGNLLLLSTFDDAAARQVDAGDAFDVLRLCRAWTRANMGFDLKSLVYLLSCGLF